jgi:hypothetical protein
VREAEAALAGEEDDRGDLAEALKMGEGDDLGMRTGADMFKADLGCQSLCYGLLLLVNAVWGCRGGWWWYGDGTLPCLALVGMTRLERLHTQKPA